jgi:DNA topoisomerase I
MAVSRALRRRRAPDQTLFAYLDRSAWHDLTAADINDYLHEVSSEDFTAKDFRTWHGTVLAAVALAVSEHAGPTPASRKRAIVRAVREVADYLGNTPAVARASYLDPRVIDRYERASRSPAFLPN